MIDDQLRSANDFDAFIAAIYTPEREWDESVVSGSKGKINLRPIGHGN